MEISSRRHAGAADNKPSTQSPEQRGYYPDELSADWDTLSNIARSTIKLTLSVDLAIRYKDIKPANNFWTARHDPNVPIAKWIACVRVAPTDLTSVKLTPGDQQICDCLLRGLDDSWKTIRDHLFQLSLCSKDETNTWMLELWKERSPFSSCPNPSIKKKSTSYETRAGAATTTKLGNYSEYEEEEDSFDETDVKWG
ncbi:hypothetical protein PSHT_05183 [Puccinia striiformis]|uniref:Uncharacterized protein n=1 Tax=Puccinia striiformis TaxID=27350 RepID=A0A2S4WBF2_9BASI|nr:hypothetical protein PSHT_05183 [Puccinia striiformis]